MRHLIDNGVEVTVMAPRDDTCKSLVEMGCQFIDLPIAQMGINPFVDLMTFWKFYTHFKRLKPEFSITYTIKPNIYGSIAAALANVPCIAVTTGLGYTFLNDNFIAKIARCLYKFALRYPREVWFLNNDDKIAFIQSNLVKCNKAYLIPGEGVDMQFYSPVKQLTEDENFRFIFVGRMLWDKGVGEYVEAARIVRKKYPKAIFQLLGACDTPNPSVIQFQQVMDWDIEGVIHYLGTTDDVRAFIANSGCVVLPSYREGIPRVMIEASSMCKPIITTNAPGCRDVIIDGETGLICQIKDVKSLAECCIQMLEKSKAERHKMGLAGRNYILENFDEKKIIDKYRTTLMHYGIKLSKNRPPFTSNPLVD